MSSPQPAQNRALLSLPVAPTTRPLSRHIMSPLYCLLLSGDDNFKAQILFAGAGGRMEAVWGRARAPGLSFSFGGGLLYVWGLPLNTHHPPRGSRAKSASAGTPYPPVMWPRPAPSPPPLSRLTGGRDLFKRTCSGNPFWSLPVSAELDVSSCLPLVFPAVEALDHQLSNFLFSGLLFVVHG